MLDLTPGERRGALTLLALLLIGTGHDLWLVRQPRAGLPAAVSRPAAAGGQAIVENAGAGAPVPPPPRPAGQVDLNRATLEELDALPGIGPVLAGRILAQRTRLGRFRSREDLFAVPGIGPKLYARLAPLVEVAGEPPAREPSRTASPGAHAQPVER